MGVNVIRGNPKWSYWDMPVSIRFERNRWVRIYQRLNRFGEYRQGMFAAADRNVHIDRLTQIMANTKVSREVAREWERKRQSGACDICGSKGEPQPNKYRSTRTGLVIDHDHATMRIRGILCIKCNVRMAWFEKYGNRASDYLKDIRV